MNYIINPIRGHILFIFNYTKICKWIASSMMCNGSLTGFKLLQLNEKYR
jgi:hypothetical protein